MSTNVLIGQRLRLERQRLRLTQTELASKVNVSKTSQINYESGERSPDAAYLAAAALAGVDVLLVLTGEASMAHDGDNLVAIPRFDVQASAGAGAVNEGGHYKVDALSVTREWLNARRLSPAHLKALKVRGTSMHDVLADGDLVVMDDSDTKPRSGFVYVIRQGDELLVKYCAPLPGGMLKVSSANAAFPAYDVDLNKVQDFVVLGRVVASMHDW